jgi:hypothetical protein
MNFKTPHAFIAKLLVFLDPWIKLLLSWSILCNDCLETMSYIYISMYTLSLNAVRFLSSKHQKFPKKSCPPNPPGQRVPIGQCLAHPDNVWPGVSAGVFKPLNSCLPHNSLLSPRTKSGGSSSLQLASSGDQLALG